MKYETIIINNMLSISLCIYMGLIDNTPVFDAQKKFCTLDGKTLRLEVQITKILNSAIS